MTVTDAKRFEGSQQAGETGKALTAASVPKINLIAGEILGSGYSILNSKGVGADYVFMWDCGAVSLIDPCRLQKFFIPKRNWNSCKRGQRTTGKPIAVQWLWPGMVMSTKLSNRKTVGNSFLGLLRHLQMQGRCGNDLR